jgi:hypothetical protein
VKPLIARQANSLGSGILLRYTSCIHMQSCGLRLVLNHLDGSEYGNIKLTEYQHLAHISKFK